MKRTPAPYDLLALIEVQEVYKLSSGKRPLVLHVILLKHGIKRMSYALAISLLLNGDSLQP
jgi:hypothetical protein